MPAGASPEPGITSSADQVTVKLSTLEYLGVEAWPVGAWLSTLMVFTGEGRDIR